MANAAAAAPGEITRETEAEHAAAPPSAATADMELDAAATATATATAEAPHPDGAAAVPEPPANGTHDHSENGTGKRPRGEGGEEGGDEVDGPKRHKEEKSAEEEQLEKLGEVEMKVVEKEGGEEEKVDGGPVKLGPKCFGSSVEMFEYFCKLLHTWSPNLDINKYECMVFMDLIKKGHPEPDKKIGGGVQAFQVRYHPLYKSRCFFLVRNDGSADDFSFRKCVDHILPLPDNMKEGKKSWGNQKGGGRGTGRGGGNFGRGGGRSGRGGCWK